MSAAQTAEVLGIPMAPHPPLTWMSDVVTQGLPVSSLDRVADLLSPEDKSFPYRVIPRPTLARRRSAHAPLSPEEGAKAARLAEVWTKAHEVWGSEEAARAFLFRPHAMLDMRRPIDVALATEFGGPLVINILGRLQHGVAV
jgi:putative toxin-antitoxin system antitoxin component (TIGR02293 family)